MAEVADGLTQLRVKVEMHTVSRSKPTDCDEMVMPLPADSCASQADIS